MEGFVCTECGKALKHRTNLRRHIAVHNRQCRFFCCGKPFKDSYHLRLHRASKHGGPKNYVCTSCTKEFASSNDLARHQRNVKREDFKTCQVCQFKARDNGALNEHMATHNSASTYSCDACDKVYKQKRSLSRHKKSKHQ